MSAVHDNAIPDVARELALDGLLGAEQEALALQTQGEARPAAKPRSGDSMPLAVQHEGRAAPGSSLELALIARRYVRSMIRVLVQIARDPNQSPAARVQAAKEIINRAVIERSELDLIDDERLKAMAAALVEKLNAERQVRSAVTVIEPLRVIQK